MYCPTKAMLADLLTKSLPAHYEKVAVIEEEYCNHTDVWR